MIGHRRYYDWMVVIITVITAIFVVSCSNKLKKTGSIDISSAPVQVVDSMVAVQSENGRLKMRMEAPVMERYSRNDENLSYEDFPRGMNVFGYNEEGLLETEISSDGARHTTKQNDEKWDAYGNVVVMNYIKGEKIETDTLHWDRERKIIYTDCYVKLSSPQGFMQGYGLRSDEMARNAELLRPFDSYGIINRDSTAVEYLDSANFIGPLYKR